MDPGDNGWVLDSAAKVMLMTWGLALFYGGLVRQRNVLATMMYAFFAIVVVSLHWAVIGYSLVFGSSFEGLIGSNWEFAFLNGVGVEPRAGQAVPQLSFMFFQMMFAVITPALIAGAVAERLRFSAFIVFTLLWSTIVYAPLAHWIWNPDGWLLKLGVLDYAGGIVVHVTAGFSALAAAWVVGRRHGDPPRYGRRPHDLRLSFLGAGLIWYGWFGFNAGSALAANGLATLASVNTHLAACAAAATWMAVDRLRHGKVTIVGALSGVIAGLVAITPAAGYVPPMASVVIGLAAGLAAFYGVLFTRWLGLDDALGIFGIHGVSGVLGAALTGIFATTAINSDPGVVDGLAYGEHGIALLLAQIIAAAAAAAIAVAGTVLAMHATRIMIRLRVDPDEENDKGLDRALHGENAPQLDSRPN